MRKHRSRYSLTLVAAGAVLLFFYALSAERGEAVFDSIPIPEAVQADSDSETDLRDEVSEESPGDRLDTAVELWYEGEANLAFGVFEDLAADFNSETLDTSEHADTAEQTYRSLIDLYREAGRYSKARDTLSALETLLEAQDSEDIDVALRSQRMELYYLEGRPADAVSQFERLADDQLRSELDARSHLIAARAYRETGDRDEAHAQIDRALDRDENLATAYELRGQLFVDSESYRDAIDAFERARALEPNLSVTLVAQSRAHIALEEYDDARTLLARATRTRPHDGDAEELLADVDEKRPDIEEEEASDRARRREVATPPTADYMPDDIDSIPDIRVGLSDSLGELWLKSSSSWTVRLLEDSRRDAKPADDSILLEGDRDALLNINLEDGLLEFRVVPEDREDDGESDDSWESEEPLLRHDPDDGWLELAPEEDEATTILFDLEHSRGQFSAGSEDRAYRGALRFGPSADFGFSVVNTLDMESYLYSVVPSEMPASWPQEALRAQAVAARSYTIANLGRFESDGYDVSGSVRSAFYRGYSGESEATTAAVDDTRGTVLTHDGEVLPTFYSANNAGHTDSPEEVWGGGPSGIVGVADPGLEWDGSPRPPDELRRWLFDEPETYSSTRPFAGRPDYRWELWVEAEEIRERLDAGVGRIRSLRSEGRTPAGRLTAVRVIGEDGETSITRDSVRRRLGSLRSNLFVMEPVFEPDEDAYPRAFVFRGAGWGHGIGLDQTGAAGYASRDATAEEILEHYFPEASQAQEY
ncbi:MAG: SpoIID/LytB domain-containing protein [Spirochaetales bacterium]